MRQLSPFDLDPDPALGRMLREQLTGTDPEGFVARLARAAAALPDRDTQWEILAHWARPGVLVAAALAGLLLGLELWRDWRAPAAERESLVAPAMVLEVPQRADGNLIFYTVLEAR